MQGMGREGSGRIEERVEKEREGMEGKENTQDCRLGEERRRREMERNDEYCRLAGQRHIRQKTRKLQSGGKQ